MCIDILWEGEGKEVKNHLVDKDTMGFLIRGQDGGEKVDPT